MMTNKIPFNPSFIGDPLANEASWTSIRESGANFKTRKLVKVNSSRVNFRIAIGALLVYLIFFIPGLALVTLSLLEVSLSRKFSFEPEIIIPIILGLIFMIIGIVKIYRGTAPIVFDKSIGFFWKGRKKPEIMINKNTQNHFTELDKIHALQLTSKYVVSKKSFYVYELNLVLENAERIHVIAHGNGEKLLKDAAVLSEFLGKPLWDATQFET